MTNLSATEITKLTTMIDGEPRGRLSSSLKTFDRLKSTLAVALGSENAAASLLERALICETYGGAEAILKRSLDARRTSAPLVAPTAHTGATEAPTKEPAPDTNTETDTAPKARTQREGTKQAALIAMLRAPDGATIGEIMDAFGWQSHTVRGAMAGALKKKLGLEVTSDKKPDGRGRFYKLPAA